MCGGAAVLASLRMIDEFRAAPAIITVIGGLAAPDRQRHWLSVAAEVIVGRWPFLLDLSVRAPRPKWFHQRQAGGARESPAGEPAEPREAASRRLTWTRV